MDLIVKECDVNGNYSGKEIVQEVATMLGVTQPACLIYIIAGIINLKKTNFNWIIYKQGFETTGLAMTWFLYTIAKHPKHQVGL